MTPRSQRVELATGLGYHVLSWDPAPTAPDDLTFVLVHGFTDLAWAWRAVAERLTPYGHVLAPDLRGHGDSDRVGAGGYYYFMDYVADLDDVIAQLARRRVILVGHSMGGSVSGYYAGLRPERLSALALLEGLGPPDMAGLDGPIRTEMWIAGWKKTRNAHKVMPSLDVAIDKLRSHDDRLGPDLARELAEHGTRTVEGGVAWKHDPLHLTMGPYPYRLDTAIKFWQRVTCPVLFVDGAQSKLNLPEAERAARRVHFAHGNHLTLDDCGHAIQRHQPARLADALIDLARSI